MSHLKKIGTIAIFLLVQTTLYAQVQLRMALSQVVSTKSAITYTADSFPQLQERLNKYIDSCKNLGYLFAGYDSIIKVDTFQFATTVNLGLCFESVMLAAGNLPEAYHTYLFPKRSQKQVFIPFYKWQKQLIKVLNKAEEQGYPFAQIFLDSIWLDSQHINAVISFNQGPLIRFDSISLGGPVHLQAQYLIHLSGIQPGMLYNEKLRANFDAKIRELPFARLSSPTAIYFYGNSAKPYLSLSQVKSNVFDGIIGFAPKSSLNQLLVLTGDIKLKLCNLWGTGLQLETAFRSYLIGSRELQLNAEIPYVNKYKLGISYAFRMLKFDSLYLELNQDFGYKIIEREGLSLRMVYKNKRFNLLYTDTSWVRQYQNIPQLHDALSNQLGLQFAFKKLNDEQYPTKGYILQLNASVAERKLLKNELIENVLFTNNNQQFYTVYDKHDLTSIQWHLAAEMKSYIPISPSFNLMGQFCAASINGPSILQQEQFRIGGLKTLKGFDEQSLFANQYISGNIEWRYLLPQNSSFILFYNQAWMNNQLFSNNQYNNAKGFGAGIQINTSNGVLSMYYAVGKINSGDFNFNAAKIHFGYNHLF